jgi:hypothetical protein
LPEPFKSAKLLPYDGTGSLSYPNDLKSVVQKIGAASGKIFVELGSWLGLTSRLISSSFPTAETKFYAVDTWKGFQNEEGHLDPRIPHIYEIFLSNCVMTRLAHKIIPIRMSVNDAAKNFWEKVDFLFVNTAQNYDAVYFSIMNWYPKLSENGVICGQDWTKENIKRAVMDAAAALNVTVGALRETNIWKINR